MDLGIRGRKALLGGASRGLGKACAFALAQEGVDVTIVARKRDVLEKTGAEIAAATGVEVTTVSAILPRRRDARRFGFAARATAQHGRPAAGRFPRGREDWTLLDDDAVTHRNDRLPWTA
jgi:NAD(P)-dependent dehydrogenase (short-subunit alcohol dehydrogenase family)